MLTFLSLFSCAPRPYERGSEQVWSDVQERPGSQTSGTPNASGTVVGYSGDSCKKSRQVWSFVTPPICERYTLHRKFPCPTDQTLRLFCVRSPASFFTLCRQTYFMFYVAISLNLDNHSFVLYQRLFLNLDNSIHALPIHQTKPNQIK